jgi:orotidine-5'-phosphate decarboxylase
MSALLSNSEFISATCAAGEEVVIVDLKRNDIDLS